MNINATRVLVAEEKVEGRREKIVIFLIKVQEEGIAWGMPLNGEAPKRDSTLLSAHHQAIIPWVEKIVPYSLAYMNESRLDSKRGKLDGLLKGQTHHSAFPMVLRSKERGVFFPFKPSGWFRICNLLQCCDDQGLWRPNPVWNSMW